MAKRIRKEEWLSADRPAALGELIHAQVRVAIEAAVHERSWRSRSGPGATSVTVSGAGTAMASSPAR
jgi:hypothetical protein